MRIQAGGEVLHVHAVAGSHIVTFGFDWPGDRAGEFQGFALHRTDHRTGRAGWVQAQKRYRSTDPGTAAGRRVSTRQNPGQTFLWADCTAEPGVDCTYRVPALGGRPERLIPMDEATAKVTTAVRTASGHAVRFNRGAVAAQEYARRSKNQPPEEVPNGAAYAWLSRGLLEALVRFIDAAAAGDALHVAIYEARHDAPFEALERAGGRGVAIHVVYDAKENGRGDEEPFPREDNIERLEQHGLLETAIGRTRNPGHIAHNEFVVLVKQGKPHAVSAGSTNWSPNGFFGQLNAGHEVRDGEVAGSPQPAREGLDRYIGSADGADAVFVTLAFSLDDRLAECLRTGSDGLRYVLMDGIKGNRRQVEKITAAVRDIRASEAARVSIGAYLRGDALDQFPLEQKNTLAAHVQFVHTRFMLADPLGDRPVVIAGSANFSLASCTQNDGNMLVVAGGPEVADICLGEFMRSYSHYAFRDAVESARRANRPFLAKPLNEDCPWAHEHFGDGFRSRQRRYFAYGEV